MRNYAKQRKMKRFRLNEKRARRRIDYGAPLSKQVHQCEHKHLIEKHSGAGNYHICSDCGKIFKDA